ERAHGKETDAKPQAAGSEKRQAGTARKPRRAVERRNPPMLFLLSSPRSGSTLLRVMLQGHPRLFSPPELHLLPFDGMKDRAQELFDGAKYVYLTRHPYAVIESFVRMRMEKLLDVNEADPLTLAEHVWASTNGNVLRFFEHVEPARRFHLCYEDLVRDPEQ